MILPAKKVVGVQGEHRAAWRKWHLLRNRRQTVLSDIRGRGAAPWLRGTEKATEVGGVGVCCGWEGWHELATVAGTQHSGQY